MQLISQSSTQSKKIPGPPVLPIVGSLPFISGKHKHLTFTNLAKEYGEIFQIRVLSRTVVVLNKLETIRQALLKQQEDFAGRPNFYTLENAVKGRTIGGRDYDLRWKRHREITVNAMHTFFTSKTVSVEQQAMEEAVGLADIFLSYQGQPFDPEMDIGLSVANVMSNILFGERYSRDDQDFIAFVKFAKNFTDNSAGSLVADFVPQARLFSKQGLRKWQYVLDVLEKLVLKKLKEHQDSYNPENMRGMVDALFKAANNLNESDKQTLGLTEDLLVEGTPQEMMGSGLQPIAPILRWVVLYMIAYLDIQVEVQQELDEVIGKGQQVYFSERKKLPFTEACIHEILRHAPYFPLAIPSATTTDTTINNYFIAENTPVFVNLYSLTRDERYWEKPEQFNPHRFLTDSREIREDLLDKYYPFGVGKRRCLAEYLARLELFTFFANLMHKCKFEKVAGEKLRFDGPPGVNIAPENYKVIVRPRF